jgi:biotin carboxyl carrier protein
MKCEVAVNDARHVLELRQTGDTVTFRNGNSEVQKASVVETEHGRFSVLINGRSYDVQLAGTGAIVDGTPLEVAVIDPREMPSGAAAGAADGHYAVKSMMPGKVVRTLVSQGDRVEAGQGIVVIEAMKMQNELKTRKAGIVVKVTTREGATVTAGELLAVVE